MFDVEKIREDFPILSREISGRPLIYLDNGATSQTPKCVVDHIADTYYRVNANVHRGVHTLSQEATDAHEAARCRVQQFIGAGSSSEIIAAPAQYQTPGSSHRRTWRFERRYI